MTPLYGKTRRWLLSMGILGVTAACRDTVAPRVLTAPNPSTIIVDGAHNNGNDDVFFLPPLVGNPNGSAGYGDPFQAGLPVEIKLHCLTKTATSACPEIDFASVRSTSEEQYAVNWDTKAAGIDPGDVYRIYVIVVNDTIAWADVALVPNSNPKNMATQDDIPLLDGRTMPIKVRIEKGWKCKNRSDKTNCVTQVVPNVAADGSGSTIVVFPTSSTEGPAAGRFYDNWIPYRDDCPASATDCVKTGTPVVVTVEDQTSILAATGATCGLKNSDGVPVTHMLTELGTGEAQHVGRCVRFTTDPVFKFATRIDVAVCVEVTDQNQQLLKYDVGETPQFLQNVFFPIACEPPTQIGSTMRKHSSNRVVDYALGALSNAGNALARLLTPRSAYAIHLGVGGLIGSGGGFSYVAPAEPYTESMVTGDGQSATVSTAVAGPQARITTVHPGLAPAVGQNVRCEITSGGGSLGSLGGPTQVVVQTQAVRNEAGAIIDAVATCPAWYLGPEPGEDNNTLRMVALNIDDGVIATEDNGEGGTVSEVLHGIVTFTATGTPAVTTGGNEFVFFGDANIFDDAGGSDPNNQLLFQNLVSYTTTQSRGTATHVLVHCGHGNTYCAPSATFDTTVSSVGYTVDTDQNPALSTPIGSTVKVVILVTPKVSFSSTELSALQSFANEGGRIVLVGEYPSNYGAAGLNAVNSVLAWFGYPAQAPGADIACDNSNPKVIIPQSQIATHQITTGLQQLTVECGMGVNLGPGASTLFSFSNGELSTPMGAVAPVPFPVVIR